MNTNLQYPICPICNNLTIGSPEYYFHCPDCGRKGKNYFQFWGRINEKSEIHYFFLSCMQHNLELYFQNQYIFPYSEWYIQNFFGNYDVILIKEQSHITPKEAIGKLKRVISLKAFT